ncbi:MAG: dihydrolipoyl dehydrogenase [Verrucomicrobiota bacterium]
MAKDTKSFEIVVVGGGPGGYVAAIRAAQLGFKVAIVEGRSQLGGTCMNVGCIPSKALLYTTEHFHFLEHDAAAHGILFKDLKIDVAKMMARKDAVVAQLGKGIAGLMKKNKIEVFFGWGKLAGDHTVEVALSDGGSATLEAENIILATGSVPVELPFAPCDGEKIITSDQGIALPEVPAKMVVIGGGAIGLELASVWNRLGSEVTVLEFLPRVAAVGFDADISRAAQRSFEKQGLTIKTGAKVEAIKAGKKGVTVQAEEDGKKATYDADLVLVAVGRKPNVHGLGAEEAGIKLTEKGRIEVNERWQTSKLNVYAIGDVVAGPMLAHKAEEEGVAVAEILAGLPGHVNEGVIPNVIYTAPEIASVGLGEDAAKERKLKIKVGKFSLMANGRALAMGATDGQVKVIADAETDRVLGVQMIAATASDLIAEAVLLMEFGGSAEDLARTVHAHPTLSEANKEAALAVDKRALHA